MDIAARAHLLAVVAVATVDADRAFMVRADELRLAPSKAMALRRVVAEEFERLADGLLQVLERGGAGDVVPDHSGKSGGPGP